MTVPGTRLCCPSCGSPDDLREIQRIEGLQDVTIRSAESEGDFDAEWESTEMLWDTVEAIGGQCRSCGWSHEDEHWMALLVPEVPE
jgi:hypothetical protein